MPFTLQYILVSEPLYPETHETTQGISFTISAQGSFQLLYPGKARGYYNRSQLLRQRGEAARAGDDEDRAVAIDPDYVAAVK